jgi:hypothetical protein
MLECSVASLAQYVRCSSEARKKDPQKGLSDGWQEFVVPFDNDCELERVKIITIELLQNLQMSLYLTKRTSVPQSLILSRYLLVLQ